MRAMRIAAAIATVLVLAAPARAAHDESGFYLIAGTPVVGVLCSPACLGVTGANLGGFTFSPNGQAPVSVLIDDVSGGTVPFTISQDIDGDGISGNDDTAIGPIEPRVEGCGSVADLTLAAVPFDALRALDVFVAAADPIACPDSLGTAGRITVTYA